jgi:GNAT superfamily N-acetyltransferase
MSAIAGPLQRQDYAPAAVLYRLVYPASPDMADAWARAVHDLASAVPRRWVALDLDSGELIGYGAVRHVRLMKYRMDLVVHPARRRQGTGTRLLTHLLGALEALGAESVQARADAADEASLSFLTRFQRMLTNWQTIPGAFFIAMHGDRPVGYSGLAKPSEAGGPVESTGTAVHPAYRRRGIAGALKICCLLYAQQHGYEQAVARTVNPAMVHINETFGFRRGSTEVRLVKRLDR